MTTTPMLDALDAATLKYREDASGAFVHETAAEYASRALAELDPESPSYWQEAFGLMALVHECGDYKNALKMPYSAYK